MYRKKALKILNKVRILYKDKHVFREINPEDFPHLSQEFYDTAQKELEAIGFRHLGDVENETAKKKIPNPRTFCRIMSSEDSTINVSIFQVKPNLFWRCMMFFVDNKMKKYWKVIEMGTTFEDGFHLITTPVLQRYSGMQRANCVHSRVSLKITNSNLLKRHQMKITSICEETGKVAGSSPTLKSVLESVNQQYAMEHKYLESIGWVTEKYLITMAKGDERMAQHVYKEIQKILAEEEWQKSRAREE